MALKLLFSEVNFDLFFSVKKMHSYRETWSQEKQKMHTYIS